MHGATMTTIIGGSLEHRILSFASEHYPLTAGELARALHVSDEILMMELRRMVSRGLVGLDVLPDKVFVRLLVVEAGPGRNAGGREDGRGFGGKGKKEGKGGDDPAYF
jgi:predicted ArsR family transcriptional regulator